MNTKQDLFLVFLLFFFLLATEFTSTCYAENSWVTKSGMNISRSGLGVVSVDGKIYAIGGATANGFSPSNEQYDPQKDIWKFKSSMPTPRSAFGIAVLEDTIYCIGGYAMNEDNKGVATGVNEAYNTSSDTWENKASMPTPQLNVRANIVKGKIYLIGGNLKGTINQVYDPITDLWSNKASIPTAVSSYASAVFEEKIFIFTSGLTQIYDTRTDTWSFGTPAPSPIIMATAVTTTGTFAPARIYIFGVDAQLPFWQLTTNGFITQSYNPMTDNWTGCNPIPIGRYSAGVTVIDDVIYVIGGHTTEFNNEGFEINPKYRYSNLNQQYFPISYGSIMPKISILSPENSTYSLGNISLTYTTNIPVSWAAYSLDGQEKVTLTGNDTLSGLTSGQHNITVYTRDSWGNLANSQTITFIIREPDFSPTIIISLGSAASATAILASTIVYFKKRKHRD